MAAPIKADIGPQPAIVTWYQPGRETPSWRIERKLMPIISRPTAAAWGNSCAPAMRAATYPPRMAAATVHVTLSSR
jgi:hypothetical protein